MNREIILPNNKDIDYCGRIDFANPQKPILIWAASYIKIRFTGSSINVLLQNTHDLWSNQMGYVLDDIHGKVILFDGDKSSDGIKRDNEKVWQDEMRSYTIADGLDKDTIHELLLYKRQDSCHYVTFGGFEIEDGKLLPPSNASDQKQLKIEVYGDSVSNGEVSEIIGYEGKVDPDGHNAKYNNAYYSYAWILARKLNARLHDVSQGGIALLDETGYFHPSGLIGVEKTWDKLMYNPNPLMPRISEWDFSKYTPDLVIIAIGQNDSHPEDYMATDYSGQKAINWREHYAMLVKNIRAKYPMAHIVMITTILIHDKGWDDSIEEVYRSLTSQGDEKLHHFLFLGNGAVTPGHIRASEAQIMADELYNFLLDRNII